MLIKVSCSVPQCRKEFRVNPEFIGIDFIENWRCDACAGSGANKNECTVNKIDFSFEREADMDKRTKLLIEALDKYDSMKSFYYQLIRIGLSNSTDIDVENEERYLK